MENFRLRFYFLLRNSKVSHGIHCSGCIVSYFHAKCYDPSEKALKPFFLFHRHVQNFSGFSSKLPVNFLSGPIRRRQQTFSKHVFVFSAPSGSHFLRRVLNSDFPYRLHNIYFHNPFHTCIFQEKQVFREFFTLSTEFSTPIENLSTQIM